MNYEIKKEIGIFDVVYQCENKSTDGHKLYHIKCKICGWETDAQLRHIYRMPQKCTHLNSAKQYHHNQTNSSWKNKRIKNIYKGMMQRCYNIKEKNYFRYGGRGIKICKEWLNNPLLFEEWSLQNGYQDDLTIDRIDSNKDYCPENCRWVTLEDNARYKSTTKIITVNNISHTGRKWAEVLELGTNTINKMLKQYPEEKVKEFISKRLENKTINRHSHQTWMKVYNL